MVEPNIQVIASFDTKEVLWRFSLEFMNSNEIDIHVIYKYLETAERLVKILTSSYGIEEYGEREEIETINKKNNMNINVKVIHLRKLGAIQ